MGKMHPVLKKLNIKIQNMAVLILNAPQEYVEVMQAFDAEVHTVVKEERYSFIQIFGTSNQTIQNLAKETVSLLLNDGLLWLCYPKKSSKTYRISDCSRDTVALLLADEGYEPVRQVAIDDDWSALRFRKVENIKNMIRKHAVTETVKRRIEE